MKRPTSLELELKSQADRIMIQVYKRQIAQLAACIADREGRIERRAPVIEKISEREKHEFNVRLSRAKDDAEMEGFAVGDRFRSGADKFNVVDVDSANKIIGIQHEETGRVLMAGKDLKTLSQMFFYDFPAATRLS